MAWPQRVVMNRADLSQGAERGVMWRGRHHGALTKETPQEWWGNPKGWEASNNLEPWRAPTPFQKQHSAEAWRPAGGSRSQVAHSSSKRMMVVLEGRVVTQETARKVSFRDELNLRVEEKAAPGIVPMFWASVSGQVVESRYVVWDTGQRTVVPCGKGWWRCGHSGMRGDLVFHGCPPKNLSWRNKWLEAFIELFKYWLFNRSNWTR